MSNSLFPSAIRNFWKQYRYRFVPWIALNLNERPKRVVRDSSADKILPDEEVVNTLSQLFQKFHEYNEHTRCIHSEAVLHGENLDIMLKQLGFSVEKQNSIIPGAGTGVVVSEGTVPKGAVVSMYPGCIHDPENPMFWLSIANPFIFRCIDGVYIDGKDRGLSSWVFTSASKKERILMGTESTDLITPMTLSDVSWMTESPLNPLAIGQYVNNGTEEYPANVAYQELDLPEWFPLEQRMYVPNSNAEAVDSIDPVTKSPSVKKLTRLVVLVSLRKIEQGEELFSNYFTTVAMLDSSQHNKGDNPT